MQGADIKMFRVERWDLKENWCDVSCPQCYAMTRITGIQGGFAFEIACKHCPFHGPTTYNKQLSDEISAWLPEFTADKVGFDGSDKVCDVAAHDVFGSLKGPFTVSVNGVSLGSFLEPEYSVLELERDAAIIKDPRFLKDYSRMFFVSSSLPGAEDCLNWIRRLWEKGRHYPLDESRTLPYYVFSPEAVYRLRGLPFASGLLLLDVPLGDCVEGWQHEFIREFCSVAPDSVLRRQTGWINIHEARLAGAEGPVERLRLKGMFNEFEASLPPAKIVPIRFEAVDYTDGPEGNHYRLQCMGCGSISQWSIQRHPIVTVSMTCPMCESQGSIAKNDLTTYIARLQRQPRLCGLDESLPVTDDVVKRTIGISERILQGFSRPNLQGAIRPPSPFEEAEKRAFYQLERAAHNDGLHDPEMRLRDAVNLLRQAGVRIVTAEYVEALEANQRDASVEKPPAPYWTRKARNEYEKLLADDFRFHSDRAVKLERVYSVGFDGL